MLKITQSRCVLMCALALLLLICGKAVIADSSQASPPMIINYGQIEFGSKLPYHEELLLRIFEVTEPEYGPFKIRINQEAKRWSIARYRRELADGVLINVSWGATSDYRPADIGHIRVYPAFMNNVNGYRLFFIRKDDSEHFKSVTSLSDLRKLRAGQNRGWVETDLFAHNELPLIESVVIRNLYGMLSRGRFDYLPLAVLEINEELKKYQEQYPEIIIEPTILLYYPSPLYWQVSQNNPVIADRMSLGMTRLIESGELLSIFEKHFLEEIKGFNLPDRKVIIMENPYVPKDSPDVEPLYLEHLAK